jgi:hypothetical protein
VTTFRQVGEKDAGVVADAWLNSVGLVKWGFGLLK